MLGPLGCFDFGAELEAEPGAELVAFGAEPADLLPADGQVGAQEATGPGGGLFPVLDADITLMPAGEQTKLVLAGSYRPPLGVFGATLDKILLHHVATATISSLLRKLARELTHDHSPPPRC